MKRLFLAAVLYAGVAGLSAGQGFTVLIHNSEEATFHYVVDPPELTAFDAASSIFENVVYDFFAEAPAPEDNFAGFKRLDPGQTARLEKLSEGKHLLVGFFVLPGEREFPVRVITLQAGGGLNERTYRLYSQPAFVMARAGRGRIGAYPPIPPQAGTAAQAGTPPAAAARTGETMRAGAAAASERAGEEQAAAARTEGAGAGAASAPQGFFRFQIDNRYEDWESVPTFLSFPADRSLRSFTRERYGGPFEVLPISQSRYWGKGGTSLNEIKVVDNRQVTYLYISTHSALSSNLSIFLYFQNERNLSRPGALNRFTLELVPSRAGEPGLAVLWEQNRKPVIAGTVASGSFFLEARIDKDRLFDLLNARPEVTYFDLTTSLFDRQELSYEEFYMGSIPLAGIPTERTLR